MNIAVSFELYTHLSTLDTYHGKTRFGRKVLRDGRKINNINASRETMKKGIILAIEAIIKKGNDNVS